MVLELLALVSGLEVSEPQLAEVCSPEERRLQAEMSVGDVSIEALLTQQQAMQACGVQMRR